MNIKPDFINTSFTVFVVATVASGAAITNHQKLSQNLILIAFIALVLFIFLRIYHETH